MKRILIAASGTGGHLFPAVYIALALKHIEPDVFLTFLGSGRPLEKTIFAKAGDNPILAVDINGVKDLGLSGLCKFLLKLPRAVLHTWQILSDVRPDCIVGVGGYVTVLPILLGKLRGIPSWIHEAELKPGLANYVLSFFANKVSVAFAQTQMPTTTNVVCTGHPVRTGLDAVSEKGERTTPPRHVLILGGSQGASALDAALPQLGEFFKEHGIFIRHQVRKGSGDAVRKAYEAASVAAEVVEFIDDMHEAYQWSDIVVSRSGAGSVMELGIVNKPSILVPFRAAQGGHQVANARLLSDNGKGVLCEEGDTFVERLKKALSELIDVTTYNRMVDAPNPHRNTDAANQIAKGVISLTNR